MQDALAVESHRKAAKAIAERALQVAGRSHRQQHAEAKSKVNRNGGAISLGYPIGGQGALLATKAIDELQRTNKRQELLTICIGGSRGSRRCPSGFGPQIKCFGRLARCLHNRPVRDEVKRLLALPHVQAGGHNASQDVLFGASSFSPYSSLPHACEPDMRHRGARPLPARQVPGVQ